VVRGTQYSVLRAQGEETVPERDQNAYVPSLRCNQ